MAIGELLFILFVLAVLWYGVKFMARVGEVRQALRRAARQAAAANAAQMQNQRAQSAIPTENLVKCRTCGAFVPANSATSCGRDDCPWGR
ncbi:MAG: hypothetical protein ACREFD_02560 [Stellaceae bacterium]